MALVRVASKAAFDLARLQPYVGTPRRREMQGNKQRLYFQVLDLELEPVIGEAQMEDK